MTVIDWDFLEKHKEKPDPWKDSDQSYRCEECGFKHEEGQRPCKEDQYFEDRYKALKEKVEGEASK